MPKGGKKKNGVGNSGLKTADYRHEGATRKNVPPASIAAEGSVPYVAKARYHYSPHLPPVLHFDPIGGSDNLPELIAEAGRRPLKSEEQRLLAEALRTHEPWLEWAGKRETDSVSEGQGFFEVDPVALHIHERVSTQAILNVAARQDVQRDLFADPQQAYHEAVQFYRHDVDWTNRLILGDSLQVMSSLARREDLAGKVQMVYIDPPYGIKFRSNFQPEVGRRDVSDKDSDLTREPEMVKAYRDAWNLGLHSYLGYLRERMIAARDLLADEGSVFVQINDQNVALIRSILDEVFGRENAVLAFVLKKKGAATPTDPVNDFIVWYAKSREVMKVHGLYEKRKAPEDDPKFNTLVAADSGAHYRLAEIGEDDWARRVGDGCVPARVNYPLVSQDPDPERSQDFVWRGRHLKCGEKRHWTYDPKVDMHRLAKAERVFTAGDSAAGVVYWSDWPYIAMSNVWDLHGDQDPMYVVQTNRTAVARCVLMTTDPGDIVLDPTCGSGTTAYVAEQWGRRWITIDTSRVAVAIARQRLMTARYEYFELRDERAGVGAGFKYKKVPHITLKSIAQNTNLDPIFAKHEPILDGRLRVANAALAKVKADVRERLVRKLLEKQETEGKKAVTDADRRRWQLPKAGGRWEHWEVPFDTDPDWPEDLQKAVSEYRKSWRAKMDEVNACIAANAEQEELVDQPAVAKGIVRVSGPFTVEAVQPPEISLDERPVFDGVSEALETGFDVTAPGGVEAENARAYLRQMFSLIRMDGIRFPNNKQMQWSRLEALFESGSTDVIHAEGRWTPDGKEDDDANGVATVGVVFGPQYGPVTAKMVEETIKPAARRYDDLVVAAFSFDGPAQAVIENASHPKLRIHMAHIRPDVNPGMAGLLKEQPGSQLFTVFGQPTIEVHGPGKNGAPKGEYIAEMQGVVIYDPVKNEIIPTSASKVAAWFLDSDYDGRTFCITQAFFPDRTAWDKLSNALGGVIDAERFEAFSGTTSLPFPPGKHRRVAVKVIDPRGNEVMATRTLGD